MPVAASIAVVIVRRRPLLQVALVPRESEEIFSCALSRRFMMRKMTAALRALLLTLAMAGPAVAQATTGEPAATDTAAVDRWPLMNLLQDTWLGRSLESSGTQVYGWIQQGFAGNPDSPRDRVNFGTDYGW